MAARCGLFVGLWCWVLVHLCIAVKPADKPAGKPRRDVALFERRLRIDDAVEDRARREEEKTKQDEAARLARDRAAQCAADMEAAGQAPCGDAGLGGASEAVCRAEVEALRGTTTERICDVLRPILPKSTAPSDEPSFEGLFDAPVGPRPGSINNSTALRQLQDLEKGIHGLHFELGSCGNHIATCSGCFTAWWERTEFQHRGSAHRHCLWWHQLHCLDQLRTFSGDGQQRRGS